MSPPAPGEAEALAAMTEWLLSPEGPVGGPGGLTERLARAGLDGTWQAASATQIANALCPRLLGLLARQAGLTPARAAALLARGLPRMGLQRAAHGAGNGSPRWSITARRRSG